MDFFETLQARHSIRAYASTPVETDKLGQLLEAVVQAPSAGNMQAFEVYIVTQSDQRKELAAAAWDQDFIAQAPVSLIFCAHADRSSAKYGRRGAELYCLQDATIACTYAMLGATALGLSTVWVGAFEEGQVSDIISAPQTHRPVAILPVGYSAEAPRVRSRRSLSDLVHKV